MDVDELAKRTMELVKEGETEEAKRLQSIPEDQCLDILKKTIHVHQRDVDKLLEVMAYAWDYYTVLDQHFNYDPIVANDDFANDDVLAVLKGLKDKLVNGGDDLDYSQAIKEVGKETGVKGRNLYFPLNLAFTGATSAPQIYEIMAIYPKETDIKLLDRMIDAF